MAYIQLSLFGKTSWERFHQATGWILEPCWNLSQIPQFQCLLLEDGQTPEWCEGERLTSHGGSWMPAIGESPHPLSGGEESSSWRILEAAAPEKYYLSPALCSRLLSFAEMAGAPPPPEIEYLLMKQGGRYRSSTPFKTGVCAERRKKKTKRGFSAASENQLTLFPPY
jgi:hypothetical protein